MEPFFFYPYKKNMYDGRKFQPNYLGRLFKKSFYESRGIKLFTSITNILGAPLSDSYYLYHFGRKIPDKNHLSIYGDFSYMKGALYGAIGLAINMGFAKAYLLGCDYLLSPIKSGHFYTYGPSIVSNKDETFIYDDLLEGLSGIIDLEVIADSGSSGKIKSQNYACFKNLELMYMENDKLIRRDYLEDLDKAYKSNQLTNQIYPDRWV